MNAELVARAAAPAASEASEAGGPSGRSGPNSLWRHRDFMRLWSAQTVSQLGTQVTVLALPLAAILVLGASPFQVGLLGTCEFLPFILVGLPAGVWVDRIRSRPVLIAADLGRAIALGSLPLAYAFDWLTVEQLYVVAFATGVLTVFFDVAYMSYLPSLVGRERLVEGNGKLEISRSTAQITGPGLAGGLVDLVTAPVALVVDALSYVGSAVLVARIRQPEPAPRQPKAGMGRAGRAGQMGFARMRSELGEGLRYVAGHRLLRPVAASAATSNLFSQLTDVVVLVFAVRELGMSPGLIGLVFSIGSVGALLAALVSGRVPRRIGLGPTIVGTMGLAGVVGLILPFATATIAGPLLVAWRMVMSFSSVLHNVSQVSLRQAITPDRLQGRMNATMRFLVWGTIPVGAFVGGALGQLIGLRPTLVVGAVGGMLAVLPLLLSDVRSLRRIPEAPIIA